MIDDKCPDCGETIPQPPPSPCECMNPLVTLGEVNPFFSEVVVPVLEKMYKLALPVAYICVGLVLLKLIGIL